MRVLNKVFQFWLHGGSFPEEGDPSTGKAWPPEIQAVITRAQAIRAGEGPRTAPLNGFIALVLAEALWDYVAVRARTWTERERGRHYLSALIITDRFGRPRLPTLPPRQSPPLPDFFVSREQFEPLILGALEQEDAQTLVLWGPGGAGKTTLAAWAAGALADRFPGAACWSWTTWTPRAT